MKYQIYLSLQILPWVIFVPMPHIPLFIVLVSLIPFTSDVSCHVYFLPSLSLQKGQFHKNMCTKVFHKIIFSFEMLTDFYCNNNVKCTSLDSCQVCHLQNHYLKYLSCKRPLILSGGRNTNAVKETENNTNKNWNNGWFVTGGGENNVFCSKSK